VYNDKTSSLLHLDLRSLRTNLHFWIALIFITGYAAVPFTPFAYLKFAFMNLVMLLIFGLSWDLLYSFSGQVSIGQAFPFGIGSLSFVLLSFKYNLPMLLSLPIAVLTACIAGGVVTLTTLRLKPDYQAVAFLLFAQVFYYIAETVYGGEGITAFQAGYTGQSLAFNTNALYIVGFVLVIASIIFVQPFESNSSKWRLRLIAIRNDPLAAASVGIDVRKYKAIIGFASSLLAGVAGAYLAFFTVHFDYTLFSVTNSVSPIGVAVVGGLGSTGGIILGAGIIGLLNNLIPVWFSNAIVSIAYGALIVIVLKLRRGGLFSIFGKWLEGKSP
jgi:branched-chain amino acid transport system permease protein